MGCVVLAEGEECVEVSAEYGQKVVRPCDTACEESLWYPDVDRDGFGDADNGVLACERPDDWYTADGSDCDDTINGVHPGADEVCNNSVDDNCDGQQNEDCPA